MKKFQFTPDGMQSFNGAMDLEGSEIDKSVQTFSGDGEWKHLHGVKLMVDKSGIVIKGFDPFIGRRFSDLERLNFSDIFTVERTVSRALGLTNKAECTPEDIAEKSELMIKVNEYIDSRLKETEGYSGYRHESMDQI